MVAFDPLEEMHAEPLQLIGADAGEDGGSGEIEIAFDGVRIERTHREAGSIEISAHTPPRSREAERRNQPMRAAGKRRDRAGGAGAVLGLVERLSVEQQHLIRPEGTSLRIRSARRDRLRLGERGGETGHIASRASKPALDLALVNIGRRRFEGDPGRRKQRPPRFAARGEDERLRRRPERGDCLRRRHELKPGR